MHGYYEVFKPAPENDNDPGKIFYTITPEDVGKGVVSTTAGPILLTNVLGRVLPGDIGKQIYRVSMHDHSGWIWQAESDAQRDARLGKDMKS